MGGENGALTRWAPGRIHFANCPIMFPLLFRLPLLSIKLHDGEVRYHQTYAFIWLSMQSMMFFAIDIRLPTSSPLKKYTVIQTFFCFCTAKVYGRMDAPYKCRPIYPMCEAAVASLSVGSDRAVS